MKRKVLVLVLVGIGNANVAASPPFSIKDPRLIDTQEACRTDAVITATGTHYDLGGKLSWKDGKAAIWCPGARHTWEGTSTDIQTGAIRRIESDKDRPLKFQVTSRGGYVYRSGKGTLVLSDGSAVTLGAGTARTAMLPSSESAPPTPEPRSGTNENVDEVAEQSRDTMAAMAQALRSLKLKPGDAQEIFADGNVRSLVRTDSNAEVRHEGGSVLFASGYSYSKGRLKMTKFRLRGDTSIEVIEGQVTTDDPAKKVNVRAGNQGRLAFDPNVQFRVEGDNYETDSKGRLKNAKCGPVNLGSWQGHDNYLLTQRGIRSYANHGGSPLTLKMSADGDWLPEIGRTVVVDGVAMRARDDRLVNAER